MTGRLSVYSCQPFLIIHGTATHPSLLSSWLLLSLVLEQGHSWGSLTETLMRVFNEAVTTNHLPLMTMLWRLHQSFVLLTSAHLCKRNLLFGRVVTRSSGNTSLLGSEWMNQTMRLVKKQHEDVGNILNFVHMSYFSLLQHTPLYFEFLTSKTHSLLKLQNKSPKLQVYGMRN